MEGSAFKPGSAPSDAAADDGRASSRGPRSFDRVFGAEGERQLRGQVVKRYLRADLGIPDTDEINSLLFRVREDAEMGFLATANQLHSGEGGTQAYYGKMAKNIIHDVIEAERRALRGKEPPPPDETEDVQGAETQETNTSRLAQLHFWEKKYGASHACVVHTRMLLEGHTLAELAGPLGITERALKERLRRWRQKHGNRAGCKGRLSFLRREGTLYARRPSHTNRLAEYRPQRLRPWGGVVLSRRNPPSSAVRRTECSRGSQNIDSARFAGSRAKPRTMAHIAPGGQNARDDLPLSSSVAAKVATPPSSTPATSSIAAAS